MAICVARPFGAPLRLRFVRVLHHSRCVDFRRLELAIFLDAVLFAKHLPQERTSTGSTSSQLRSRSMSSPDWRALASRLA